MKTFILVFLLFAASSLRAQNFNIDWFTIDGGGGTSMGSVYSISGTIGQFDAGLMKGGTYSLTGGFWSVVEAIQTPGAPLLAITRDRASGAVTVSWPKPADGWVLDQTSALAATPGATSWSQVVFPYQTNSTHISVIVPSPVGNRFYRLRQ
jgi:hypothetical protein